VLRLQLASVNPIMLLLLPRSFLILLLLLSLLLGQLPVST
jgi:hypothetical protein